MPEMGFEYALAALKQGRAVARAGWNGRGMHLRVVDGAPVVMRDPMPARVGHEMVMAASSALEMRTYTLRYAPHIAMFTATREFVPWLASVTDLMAEDWMVVDPASQRLTDSAPV